MTTLTTKEEGMLKTCEATIKETQQSFFECGMALATIKDHKLYARDFDTFEEYCHEKWGWDRSYAYRLVEAAEIKMSPMGDKITNERQARALAKVPEKDRAEVLKVAEAAGGITAASIAKAAGVKPRPAPEPKQPRKIVLIDKVGQQIPDCILSDWKKADEVEDLISKMSDVRSAVRNGIDEGDMAFAELTNTCLADFNNSYNSLALCIPYAVCPTCQGQQRKKCQLCKGRGFLSKFRFTQCVPSETKAMLKARAVK